jgi:Flp pilus assembly protein CpaB
MRRGRLFIYLLIIIVLLAILGVVFWYQFMQPPAGPSETEPTPTPVIQTVNVVIAAQSISRGAAIQMEQLTLAEMPEDVAEQTGMFMDITDVVGRQARLNIDPGNPILSSLVMPRGETLEGTGSPWAADIPPGMVAIPIEIDVLSSVAYGVRKGDHVNVLLNMSFVELDVDFQTPFPNRVGVVMGPGPLGEPVPITVDVSGGIRGRAEIDPVLGQTMYVLPNGEQRARRVSQTIFQNVRVLHVGEFPVENAQPTPTPDPNALPEDQPDQAQVEAPELPKVITLIVEPQQAVSIHYLISTGARLTLVLRSTGDESRVETESVTLQFLLDQYNIRVPLKLPIGEAPAVPAATP